MKEHSRNKSFYRRKARVPASDPPSRVADLSYHDPDRFRIDPAALAPDRQAAMASNRAALLAAIGEFAASPLAGAD